MSARPGRFARLVNTFYADGDARIADDVLTTWHDWERTAFRSGARHLAPGTRTDYVYAADSSYAQTVRTSDLSDAALDEYPKEFRAGRSTGRDWGRAPQHPTLPRRISCPLCRADTGASFLLAPYGDSDPGHYGTGVSSTTYTYRRDGQELPAAQLFAPQEAEYRIDQTVRRRTTALETLGTRTDTSYTFRSKAPGAGDTATGCTEVFGARPSVRRPAGDLHRLRPRARRSQQRTGRPCPARTHRDAPDRRLQGCRRDGRTRRGVVRRRGHLEHRHGAACTP